MALVSILVGLLFYFSRAPEIEEGAPLSLEPADTPRAVKVIRPKAAPHSVVVRTTGEVSVRNHVPLAPETSGRVVWVSDALRAGGSFDAGQTLLRIASRDHEIALEQAMADLKVAKAALVLREAESEASIRNYTLLHPGEEVPSLVARVPQIEQAKAQIASVKARVAAARLELSRTDFSLPFIGHVLESRAEVGLVLTRNQTFGRVFASDSVEVLVSISARERTLLDPLIGRVAVATSEERQFRAIVRRTSPDFDPRTRMASVILSPEQDEILAPGTFVDVSIQGPTIQDAFELPEASEQAHNRVWIVLEGRIVAVSPRVLGRSSTGAIVEAFNYGEGIVVGTVAGSSEGMEVSPIETAL